MFIWISAADTLVVLPNGLFPPMENVICVTHSAIKSNTEALRDSVKLTNHQYTMQINMLVNDVKHTRVVSSKGKR